MRTTTTTLLTTGISLISFGLAYSGASSMAGESKNPCNPCAAAAKSDPKTVTRPAGIRIFQGNQEELLKKGEQLWNNAKLSTNGLSCNSCHSNHAGFNATFAKPFPHLVKMVKLKSGLPKIELDEMVQFCLVNPMAAKPLPWDSKELAALTMYSREIQKTFKPQKTSPRKVKNPCNPCGG